jgi:Plasmid pRiA4b ORF-3-like protein
LRESSICAVDCTWNTDLDKLVGDACYAGSTTTGIEARRIPALELEGHACQTGGMKSTAKLSAPDSFNQIATIRIELRGTDPVIWRQVEVPTSVTLNVLHDIVQAVMGWFDYHLWEFTIDKRRYGLPMDEDWGTMPRIEATKVRLRDILKLRKTIIDYLLRLR